MKWYDFIFVFIIMLGACESVYQIFKMTELDAASRGLKHPKFWGLFASGSQNGSGLLVYLMGRKKYPSTMSTNDKAIIESRKKKIGAGLLFMVFGSIALILSIIL